VKTLAIFDFDGTITTRDTLLEFTKFVRGKRTFYVGMLLLSPALILYKLKLIPNWKAKEYYLSYFFGGMNHTDLEEKAREFTKNRLESLIRPKALQQLEDYKAQPDTTVLIATASATTWVAPWAESHRFEIVGTSLELNDGHVTGKIHGKNCYGQAKLEAVRGRFDLSAYDEVHFYGDSSGDRAFEGVVARFFYRHFE